MTTAVAAACASSARKEKPGNERHFSRSGDSGLLVGCAVGLAVPERVFAADKVRVLIVDGQNNHNWRR